MLQEEVKKHKENSNVYKLFIGFKKLGEFSSIQEAKQYSTNTQQAGRFSLLGDKYHDTWYISQWDVRKEQVET